MSPGPRGRTLFFKKEEGQGFKMISIKDIPFDILATMEPEKPVDDTKPEFRKCIFCGGWGSEQKFINREMVSLCLEHFQNKTTGEVVEQLRSIATPPSTSDTEDIKENYETVNA